MKTLVQLLIAGLLFTVAIVETNLNKESPKQIEQRIEQERKEAQKIDEIKAKILNTRH